MEDNTNPDDKAWFRKKRHGIGYSPNTWQGWLVVLAVVIIIIVIATSL
jgi:uncharacterized membrane protein